TSSLSLYQSTAGGIDFQLPENRVLCYPMLSARMEPIDSVSLCWLSLAFVTLRFIITDSDRFSQQIVTGRLYETRSF
ncbi:MAG: hypothetical protein ACK2U5_10405, partial [Candidatus Promineifilaceae bacterium]